MSIDEALKIIKDGRIVATIIKGNNEDDTKFNQENIEALNMIIVTMHKYQKIQEIMEHWVGTQCVEVDLQTLFKIREVIEDEI